MKTRVFHDTNFLMMPYSEGIDVFSEIKRLLSSDAGYEICTLESVKCELAQLAEKSRGKDRIAAQVGLQLIESKNMTVVDGGSGSVDSQLIDLAERDKNIIVCTNDRPLKSALRDRKIRLIIMRSRTHLEYC
jgi:rRNA-processing protein FCF1